MLEELTINIVWYLYLGLFVVRCIYICFKWCMKRREKCYVIGCMHKAFCLFFCLGDFWSSPTPRCETYCVKWEIRAY